MTDTPTPESDRKPLASASENLMAGRLAKMIATEIVGGLLNDLVPQDVWEHCVSWVTDKLQPLMVASPLGINPSAEELADGFMEYLLQSEVGPANKTADDVLRSAFVVNVRPILDRAERAEAANHGVAVCKEHTSAIVGDGCLVCDIATLKRENERLRGENAELLRRTMCMNKHHSDEGGDDAPTT